MKISFTWALAFFLSSAAASDAVPEIKGPSTFSTTRLLDESANQTEDFDSNPLFSPATKSALRPYIIPDDHPCKPKLDAIFRHSRAILNEKAFGKAGFHCLHVQPRSFIRVARHPSMPGYLVKVALDDEKRLKKGKTECYWFLQRCRGSQKIADVIKKKKIRHFTVAKKWIYPLPSEPSLPDKKKYDRKYIILLVTDMKLASKHENLVAWRTKITREHLEELYTIISHSNGSSYRPDNIHLTKSGKFAFIDTEYPDRIPEYRGIRPFLSPEMRPVWDSIIQRKR